MSNPGIHIHRLIVHRVDHKASTEPVLSDLESPTDDPDVLAFLRSHIHQNSTHTNVVKARFRPSGTKPDFPTACDKLFAEPSAEFVPQTRWFATHLFASMDRRMDPGDLVVVTYSLGSPSSLRRLALFKMDPSEGFVGETRTDDGRSYVVLHRVDNVLPRQVLQKCAFVLPPSLREEADHDLLVLDQQRDRYGIQAPVASFFSEKFLSCDLALSSAFATREFWRVSWDWISQIPDWPQARRERAVETVSQALKGERVSASGVAASLTADASERQEYLSELRAAGLDHTFAPDKAVTEKALRYTYYAGEGGLRVRIETKVRDAMLTEHRDEDTGLWTITIESYDWKRIRG